MMIENDPKRPRMTLNFELSIIKNNVSFWREISENQAKSDCDFRIMLKIEFHLKNEWLENEQ